MARVIKTVVIPAAGRGTRLLPLTKSTPKELLQVYDRPALQFAIDEAIALRVDRIVVVTHPDKPAIRDYLTPDPDAIAALRAGGKAVLGDLLSEIAVPEAIDLAFVDQHQPLGLGHAILCAEPLVLPGPFAVILPDDLILGAPALPEMAVEYTDGHMIAAMEVRPEETGSYGIFELSRPPIGRSQHVIGMVEKPAPGQAPSRLAAVGRYILDPSIFATLKSTRHGAGGEIQLTDAINRDADSLILRAFRFSGTRYDCGTIDGLLSAAIASQRAARDTDRPAAHPAALPGPVTPGPTSADHPPLAPGIRVSCGASTGKELAMDWTQISDDWAAMTRRLCKTALPASDPRAASRDTNSTMPTVPAATTTGATLQIDTAVPRRLTAT